MCPDTKRERHWDMVGTNDNRKTRRIELRGQLRQRTTNGVYSYRLTVANGTRKEFFLRTSNYDEAVRKASDLDSIWLAPTQEVALAQWTKIEQHFKMQILGCCSFS